MDNKAFGNIMFWIVILSNVAHFTPSRCFQNGAAILKDVTTCNQENNPVSGIKIYKNSGQQTNDSFPTHFIAYPAISTPESLNIWGWGGKSFPVCLVRKTKDDSKIKDTTAN